MRPKNTAGSITLVALSCVAVLGIALASYLALSNSSMKLSNRAYAQDVSRHLAEMGLERALRSFNYNTFSSWTISGSTASQSFTIASSQYGTSGITTTVNLRVDNYDAFIKDAVWNSTTNYRVDQFVLHSGTWYRCNTAHKNQTPPGANWNTASGSATATWNSSAYNIGDIVYRTTSWYRCIQSNTNQAPPNATYWSTAPLLPLNWTSGAYELNDIVYDRGTWYRCILAHATSQQPPNATYWASAATSNWDSASTYSINDYVSFGGVWYRCIQSHSNKTPNDAAFWATNAPVIYAEGVATLPDGTSTVKTQLRAVVAPAPLFPNAAAAASTLLFSSGGTVDSYDSSLGSYGSQTPGASAVLAGGNTASTAVTLTSTNVKGYLAAPAASTSPYAPRFSVGASARLTNAAGAVSLPHATAANVDLNRISRSPYIPKFDILTPNTTGVNATALPGSGTLGSNTDTAWRTYILSGNLNITDSRTYTIDGPVRIVVSGYYYQNLSGGPAQIIVSNNSRARLEMYIGGDIAIYGNGIDNQTRDPSRLAIYATTSSTAPDLNTGTDFYGVIYFTNTSSRFTVLGNRTFYGALSANNLTFSGSPIIHYDTKLRYTSFSGTDNPYIFSEVRELTSASERVTLP